MSNIRSKKSAKKEKRMIDWTNKQEDQSLNEQGIDKAFKRIKLSDKQNEFFKTIMDNDITFCSGPAGSSKTFGMCYSALQLLRQQKIKEIILCKPIQEAGENLGFLPGDIKEKTDVYMQSYYDNFYAIVGERKTKEYIDKGVIKVEPLAYMRGRTYNDAIMLLDEAQNTQEKQLLLFVTRIGKNSKIVCAGDVSQHDIKYNLVVLPKFIEMCKGINIAGKSVGTFEFNNEDVVRHPIIQEIVSRYEQTFKTVDVNNKNDRKWNR